MVRVRIRRQFLVFVRSNVAHPQLEQVPGAGLTFLPLITCSLAVEIIKQHLQFRWPQGSVLVSLLFSAVGRVSC